MKRRVAALRSRYRYSVILLKQLVKTDFKLRYQNSVLGYVWSLLRPLLIFVILYFVFTRFLKIGDTIPHYPVYLLLGIVLWNYFAEVTVGSVMAIVGRGDLLRKINFPRYVIILAGSFAAFINLLLNFVVIAVFMYFGHVGLTWRAVIILPLIAEMFILALAAAFFLSALYVKFRDVSYIWEVVMQGAFYATPILYPLSRIPHKAAKILILNPMAQIIQDARHVLVTPAADTIYQVYGGDKWIWAIPLGISFSVVVAAALYLRNSPNILRKRFRMAEDIVIDVEHVSKDFVLPHERVNTLKGLFTGIGKRGGRRGKEKQHALKNVSFKIKQGEFFGIVGRNGSGKSTLLKLLAGIYQPNKGTIVTRGKIIPFIELGVGFNPELTGQDNVYLNGALFGFSKTEVDAMYDEIVDFAELERFMGQKLKNYSSGMQVRLAFSLAIKAQADILLIDEVLAVGDTAFQQKCLNYFHELKRNKKTVVFVSHNMEAVEQFCDRAILINDSELVFEGTSHEAATQYRRMFSDEVTSKTGTIKAAPKRWGDKQAVFDSYQLTREPDTITIKTEISYVDTLEDVVCGFSITGNAQFIVGTNTYIEGVKLQKYTDASHKLKLSWSIPNIFANGTYQVSLGLITPSRSITHDWIDEALQFTVLKEVSTNHLVEPPIGLKITSG